MSGLNVSLEITGDLGVVRRLEQAHRSPRRLMKQVAVLGMSSSSSRLARVLSQGDDAVRSGSLAASISPGDVRTGTPGPMTVDTIFEVDDLSATIGTSLPYAAQVHHGGTILPRQAKALAIPLVPALQRQGIGPRELDPSGDLLKFVPYTGSKPNVFALLVDDAQPLVGRQRKKQGGTPYGPGPLYALAYWVTQEPRPFMYWDEDDHAVIRDELYPMHLGLNT